MKISKTILEEMGACRDGLVRFIDVHGDTEINFSECVKSESNTVQDYFWFIRNQKIDESQKLDLRYFSLECAERVLHIFENKYPADKRPRIAIETAKLFLTGDASKQSLIESIDAAYAASAAVARAAVAAYARAASAAVARAASAAVARAAVARAASAAYAASAAAARAASAAVARAAVARAASAAVARAAVARAASAAYDDESWQKQRLYEIVSKWESKQ